jgi:SpoVK/Ycf46/Vps4 family AAA+-type ATPase
MLLKMQSQNHISDLNTSWLSQKSKHFLFSPLKNNHSFLKKRLYQGQGTLLTSLVLNPVKSSLRNENRRSQPKNHSFFLSSCLYSKISGSLKTRGIAFSLSGAQAPLRFLRSGAEAPLLSKASPLALDKSKNKGLFKGLKKDFYVHCPKANKSGSHEKYNSILLSMTEKKQKSKKLTHFLQYLLYQDLNKKVHFSGSSRFSSNHLIGSSLDKGSFPENKKINSNISLSNSIPLASPKRSEKNPFVQKLSRVTFGEKIEDHITSDHKTNGLLISGLNKNTKNFLLVSQKKWSFFFPYRKSFICYWLLPAMGFISYLSNSYKDKDYSFLFPNRNISVTHDVISNNNNKDLISTNKNWAVLVNTENQTPLFSPFIELKKGEAFLSKNLTDNLNSKVPFLSLNYRLNNGPLKNGLTDFWYQTFFIDNSFNDFDFLSLGIHSQPFTLPLANTKKTQFNKRNLFIYPDKYYSAPLNKMKIQSTFASSPNNSIQNDTNSFTVNSGKNCSDLVLLLKVQNVKKIGETTNKDHLLGLKRKNLFLLSGAPAPLLSKASTLALDKKNQDKFLLRNSKPFFKNPLLSYKKASFLIDEYLKALVILNTDAFKVHMKVGPLPHFSKIKNPLANFPMEFNSFNNGNQILLEGNKIQNLEVFFPSYFNKIVGNSFFLTPKESKLSVALPHLGEKLFSRVLFENNRIKSRKTDQLKFSNFILFKKSKAFLKKLSNSNRFSMNNNLTKIKKLSFLEEMISFLVNQNSLVKHPNNLINSMNLLSTSNNKNRLMETLDFDESSIKESNHNGSSIKKTKKLSKDQLYFIILNSFKTTVNSFVNHLPNEFGQDKMPKEANFNQLNQKNETSMLLVNQKFSDNSLLTLTHPLMFSPSSLNFKCGKATLSFDSKGVKKNKSLLSQEPEPSFNNKVIVSRPLLTPLDSGNMAQKAFLNGETRDSLNSPANLNILSQNQDFGFNNIYFPTNAEMRSTLSKTQNLKELKKDKRKNEIILDTSMVKYNSNFSLKYVNFVSFKLKHFLTPFYPSVFNKGANKKQHNGGLSGLSQSNNLILGQKRIEKIMRSYLSKKRNALGYNKQNSISPLLKKKSIAIEGYPLLSSLRPIKEKFVLDSAKIVTLQKKTSRFLLKRKNLNLSLENHLLSNNGQFLIDANSFYSNKGTNETKQTNMIPSSLLKNPSQLQSTTIQNFLKNRSFILKKITNPINRIEAPSESLLVAQSRSPFGDQYSSFWEKLEKRKYAQKKHRRKKQRKETRRRKKRKRFYPRPSWSRYKMYQNILKRISLPTSQTNFKSLNNQFSPFLQSKNLGAAPAPLNMISLGENYFLETLPLYSTKDFYQIKRSVLGELKRAFWKSYWLRSNLNPYLKHIKKDFKEIEKASTKEMLYINLRSLILSLSGLTNINGSQFLNSFDLENRILNESNKQNDSASTKVNLLDSNFYTNLHFLIKEPFSPKVPRLQSSNNSNLNPLNLTQKLNNLGGALNSVSFVNNKWQLITQISEHNRIMYERIQNLILNIRENLTLNGQFKARPYKRPSYQKLSPLGKSLSSLKQTNPNNPQNNDFWSKLGKTTSSVLTQSSPKYYGNYSKYRLYWAIHKSNLGSFQNINKVKSIWMNTKNREQSKANKTKKIFYDIQKRYSSFLANSLIEQKFQFNQLNLKSPKYSFIGTNSENTYYPESSFSKLEIEDNSMNSKKGFAVQFSLQVSERKLKQKEQKLNFLGFSNSHLNLSNINQKFEQNSGQLLPGHIKKFTNEINYWWSHSSMKFVPRFQNDFSLISSTSSLDCERSSVNFTNKITVLGALTFLFHFCALISLISISQIRDVIKFVLIVSSKVSKVYFHLIYSSLNSFVDLLRNLGLSPLKKLTNNQILESGWMFSSSPKNVYNYKGTISHSFLSRTGLPELPTVFPSKTKSVPINWQKLKTNIKETKLSFYNQLVSFLKKFFFLPITQKSFGLQKASNKGPEEASTKVKTIGSTNLLQAEGGFGLKSLAAQLSLTKKIQIFYSIVIYSIVNALIFSLSNFSNLLYSYFLKSLNFIESFVRSIYTFLEKPGELIIDWMAYFFLVEWSSDLTNTIPDTLDTTFSNSFQKFSQSVRFPLQPVTYFSIELGNRILFRNTNLTSSVPLPLSSSIISTFSVLSGGLIQRRILSMYEIFINIACQPDTDLMSRQQKGSIFWDLWSDLLIGVAEDSNINVSELSNLKEEQNRLLEKLITIEASTLNKNKNLRNMVNLNSDSLMSSNQILNKHMKRKKPYSSRTPLINRLRLVGRKMAEKKENTSLKLISFPNSPKEKLRKILPFGEFNPEASLKKQKGHILNKVIKIRKQNLSKAISWSTSQFLSYQGKDTELFIDLHPPKSFSHITSIKYSESINQPIGLVLCQIFSGLFSKQIAKNLLVVGPPGNEKSMLIQAIAGETEFKIITDNAHRYAMVFRGVAVGIKLLRDVFEALTLHTPCLFLLEDIHAIGERRPFLISDDENSKGTESSIYQDRDEIHEKNQVIYQLTKHIISHYKKPYKGDFSLLIPTNHFCFDLFNSTAINVQRNKERLTPSGPLSLTPKSLTPEKTESSSSSLNKYDSKIFSSFRKKNQGSKTSYNPSILASSLQLPKNQLLAPPATSPFSVLVLKEEKKFKPKKIVNEFPWAGLPGEQYANLSKATYSIRVKVALLADMVLSNLSVKLDMITDLLVIIDSVKGNRGFVVFATTHVPYILDPALRRPGRFDETLTLPQIPNLLSRWHITKTNINLWQYQNSTLKKSPTSSLNYGEPFSIYPIGISVSLWQTNNSFLNLNQNLLSSMSKASKVVNNDFYRLSKGSYHGSDFTHNLTKKTKRNSMFLNALNFSLNKFNIEQNSYNRKLNFQNFTEKTLAYQFKGQYPHFRQAEEHLFLSGAPTPLKDFCTIPFLGYLKQRNNMKHSQSLPMANSVKQKSFKNRTVLTLRVYNIVSKIFISLKQCTISEQNSQYGMKASIHDFSTKVPLLRNAPLATKNKWGDFSLSLMNSDSNSFFGTTINKALSKDSLIYTSLYSSPHIFKQHLTILMAGQLGSSIAKGNILTTKKNRIEFINKKLSKTNLNELQGNSTNSSLDTNPKSLNGTQFQLASLMNLTSIDNIWRTATSLVFSFIQKRWIYGKSSAKKNLIVPRLLDFGLEGQKIEIPNPPSSNILLPAKRYENYKRTFTYSQLKRKTMNSINNQIQLHQQQRLVKRLYNIPLKEYFRSEILTSFNVLNQFPLFERNETSLESLTNNSSHFTTFSNASIVLTPLENIQQKPTSMNWYFRHRLLNRHHTYLSNQWWNGQLQEHNPESTFLSDIDWRYTISSTKEGGIGDLFIDFPDAEQYYNPKNQRWINTSGSWNSWFDFQKTAYQQYSSHYIFECLTNAYKCLDQNRELLDYYVINILEKGMGTGKELDELDILELFKLRFYMS